MVGGGQLSRMSAQAAISLGVKFAVLATSADESAAQVAAQVFLGEHTDLASMRSLAQATDVVTFDHEHVPGALLEQLIDEGFNIQPNPNALQYAQDKVLMRQKLEQLGVAQPDFRVIQNVEEAAAFANQYGFPIVLKISRGGYDGRGVWVCQNRSDIEDVLSQKFSHEFQWLSEEYIPFSRELSAQVARSVEGQMVTYPVVESRQVDGMCSLVIAPAPNLDDKVAIDAQQLAMTIADSIGVTGMLAVELFESSRGILVNELAMRPHNSGHWTIDGATTSQFENHLRAVLNLPLGDPTPTSTWTVMVNIIGGKYPDMYAAYKHCFARDPGLKVHLYGKEVRPGRKVGHVSVCSDELDDALRRAQHAADYFMGVIEE